jgi:hypothetical protein
MPFYKDVIKKTRLSDSSPELWARAFRRFIRRIYQMRRYDRWSMKGIPIFFANSFPKSGTHLLTQVLESFPLLGPAVNSGLPAVVMVQGDTGLPRSHQQVVGDLSRLLPGDINYGHVHAFPGAVEILSQSGWATYFILRDPRDVVISHVHYISEMEPRHIHHQYYTQVLTDFNARLRISIQGLTEAEAPLPNIRRRFEPFLGWLNQTKVLTLHFEDFIRDRDITLGTVIDHAVRAGFTLNCPRSEAIELINNHLDPKRSPTFRSGKVGSWQQHFTNENKQIFKDLAGDLLIELGYETGFDW